MVFRNLKCTTEFAMYILLKVWDIVTLNTYMSVMSVYQVQIEQVRFS
jgi:hypothetical protein